MGKRGGVSKGFHCFKVILILHVKLKCSLKKHCLFFTTTFRVLVFWLFWMREKREKENKDPRDEMLAVLTHCGRKAQS